MKYALVDGSHQQAQPHLSGRCPACDREMVAKCGEVKIWHWAHRGRRACDPWWENETEWHRAWKDQFPDGWQEVIHSAEDGTRHIADVKTESGWIIEFQHSYLKPEERRARDVFYPKLVWVVDGTRRKRDAEQLSAALKEGTPLGSTNVRWVSRERCALLREWASSGSLVFFDFGQSILLWLLSAHPEGQAYIAPFSRADFIEIHRDGDSQKACEFEEFVEEVPRLIADYESHTRAQLSKAAGPRSLSGFRHYLARKDSRRRRL